MRSSDRAFKNSILKRSTSSLFCTQALPDAHFLKSHENFTGQEGGNYFCFVSGEIGSLILEHRRALDVWVGLEKLAR